MKKIFGLLILSMFFFPGGTFAGKVDENGSISTRLLQMRDVWQTVRLVGVNEKRKSELTAARLDLGRVNVAPDGVATSPTVVGDYLDARIAFLQGETISRKDFKDDANLPMYIEMIYLARASFPSDPAVHDPYQPLEGRLLPLGVWNGNIIQTYSFIKPERPRVPKLNREKSFAVADLLSRAGLWDLAWRAYAEAIYSCYAPNWPTENHTETWISEDVAERWIGVAEYARKAGKIDLANGFLCKAAVFGNEETQKKALEIADKWNTETTTTTATVSVDETAKRDALKKVVRLYAEMNAQPRAFQLMDDYPEVFKDDPQFRKEIEEQWLAIVKRICIDVTNVTLYGTQVYPTGDPLKVRIPWAFSDEAIRAVREQMSK